jgi:hypothetical protein
MNWNRWIRQTHRWLSMAFTAAVIVNIIAIAQRKYGSFQASGTPSDQFWPKVVARHKGGMFGAQHAAGAAIGSDITAREIELDGSTSWYLQSVKTWRRIEHPNYTSPNSFQVGDPAVVANELKLNEGSARFFALDTCSRQPNLNLTSVSSVCAFVFFPSAEHVLY